MIRDQFFMGIIHFKNMHKTHFLFRAMLLVFFVVGSLAGMAQVSLTATSGTVTGTYTTLKGAFDKINDGTHKGIIVLKITASTTEAATASLTASAIDPASAPYYTSINIYPPVQVRGRSRAPLKPP